MPLRNLNEEQLASAKAKMGSNLIIASAGTGKTSTIVGRIAHLLSIGVEPNRILLLTFTNKASSEMISRVAKFFGEKRANSIEAGTFHSVSYRWLKRSSKKLTLKSPKELKLLFKTIYDRRDFSNFYEDRVKPYTSSHIYDLYSLFLNSNKEQSFDIWLEQNYPEHQSYIDIYCDLIDEFNHLKREFGYLNFDDLLILAKEEIVEQKIEFDEILVDEYQDTNRLQNSLINSLSRKSLFCVGDYDQSIYGFNGSDISIISTFQESYQDSKVFTLKRNYRSGSLILDLANRVISRNERIYPKELEVVRVDSKTPPKLLGFPNIKAQYREIAKMISSSTCKKSEIAVIFRNNSTADGVEAILREFSIPAKRKGSLSFFDSKEIKLILDIATIAVNPRDMMAFIHIFEYIKGVGSSSSKEIFDALSLLGDGDILRGLFSPKDIPNPFKSRKNFQLGLFDDIFVEEKSKNFAHLIKDSNFLKNPILKYPKLNDRAVEFIYNFYQLFKNLNSKKPTNLIRYISNSTLFRDIKSQIATDRATSRVTREVDRALKEEALLRIETKVDTLVELSKSYFELDKFLNALILANSEITEGEGVNLLTVHSSKGLEFKEVYIVDLMEGRFPNRKLISKGSSLNEERRLFYVALTRAKDILYLSFAKKDTIRDIDYEPSCFLYEANLIK